MILRDGLLVGAKNHLFIGGCDTVELANTYGTPLYAMDELYIRQMCHEFVDAMNLHAPGGLVCYASKAFSTVAMCKLIEQEGLGLDVVSGGELYTALKANFPMERVTLHGSSKTPYEMRMAVELGVGHIVIDNQCEIPMLQRIAEEAGRNVRVQLRLNPGIDIDTHQYIRTAAVDSKFGLGIDDGEALQATKNIAHCPNLTLTGVHVHLGSQLFSLDPYITAIDLLTNFMALASAITGAELGEIILGGGFGVQYTQEDPPALRPCDIVKALARETKRQATRKGLGIPRLMIEPGRMIIAESGITLYTVSGLKAIPGIRTYLSVDGSMADNPRPAIYGAKYEAILANRANETPNNTYAIAGHACESGDIFGYDFRLPHPDIGDILAMFTTGAYHYAMASNYNRLPVPAVVFCRYGKSEPIVLRQTYEDIVRNDRVPSWM